MAIRFELVLLARSEDGSKSVIYEAMEVPSLPRGAMDVIRDGIDEWQYHLDEREHNTVEIGDE